MYQTVIASPRLSSTGVTTNSPSQRRSRRVAQHAVGRAARTSRRRRRTRTCSPAASGAPRAARSTTPATTSSGAEHGQRPADAGGLAGAGRLLLATSAVRRTPWRRRMPRRRRRRAVAATGGADELAVLGRGRPAAVAGRHQPGEVDGIRDHREGEHQPSRSRSPGWRAGRGSGRSSRSFECASGRPSTSSGIPSSSSLARPPTETTVRPGSAPGPTRTNTRRRRMTSEATSPASDEQGGHEGQRLARVGADRQPGEPLDPVEGDRAAAVGQLVGLPRAQRGCAAGRRRLAWALASSPRCRASRPTAGRPLGEELALEGGERELRGRARRGRPSAGPARRR